MDTWLVVSLGLFSALVLGVFFYIIARLLHEPHNNLDERSKRLARFFLYPRLFDPLLAKPLTRREKIGWLIVLLVAIAAIAISNYLGHERSI
jgi:uncharacterized PurR-regulated membrane protein YhhQ (DUF165 family)